MRKRADVAETYLWKHLNALQMSQKELAQELGITTQTISRWAGNPPNPVKAYLSLRLKCDPHSGEYLTEGSEAVSDALQEALNGKRYQA